MRPPCASLVAPVEAVKRDPWWPLTFGEETKTRYAGAEADLPGGGFHIVRREGGRYLVGAKYSERTRKAPPDVWCDTLLEVRTYLLAQAYPEE